MGCSACKKIQQQTASTSTSSSALASTSFWRPRASGSRWWCYCYCLLHSLALRASCRRDDLQRWHQRNGRVASRPALCIIEADTIKSLVAPGRCCKLLAASILNCVGWLTRPTQFKLVEGVQDSRRHPLLQRTQFCSHSVNSSSVVCECVCVDWLCCVGSQV